MIIILSILLVLILLFIFIFCSYDKQFYKYGGTINECGLPNPAGKNYCWMNSAIQYTRTIIFDNIKEISKHFTEFTNFNDTNKDKLDRFNYTSPDDFSFIVVNYPSIIEHEYIFLNHLCQIMEKINNNKSVDVEELDLLRKYHKDVLNIKSKENIKNLINKKMDNIMKDSNLNDIYNIFYDIYDKYIKKNKYWYKNKENNKEIKKTELIDNLNNLKKSETEGECIVCNDQTLFICISCNKYLCNNCAQAICKTTSQSDLIKKNRNDFLSLKLIISFYPKENKIFNDIFNELKELFFSTDFPDDSAEIEELKNKIIKYKNTNNYKNKKIYYLYGNNYASVLPNEYNIEFNPNNIIDQMDDLLKKYSEELINEKFVPIFICPQCRAVSFLNSDDNINEAFIEFYKEILNITDKEFNDNNFDLYTSSGNPQLDSSEFIIFIIDLINNLSNVLNLFLKTKIVFNKISIETSDKKYLLGNKLYSTIRLNGKDNKIIFTMLNHDDTTIQTLLNNLNKIEIMDSGSWFDLNGKNIYDNTDIDFKNDDNTIAIQGKQYLINNTPEILNINIQRTAHGGNGKNNSKILIEENIFINGAEYKLLGFIEQLGSGRSGHYIFVKYDENDNKYILFNDSRVNYTNPNLTTNINVYQIAYKLIKSQPFTTKIYNREEDLKLLLEVNELKMKKEEERKKTFTPSSFTPSSFTPSSASSGKRKKSKKKNRRKKKKKRKKRKH